jgi:hypothetical protein
MARRTTLTQQTQIGLETTSGTAVAANRRLRSLGIELGPEGNINTFRATGSKYPAIASLGKEWSSGDLEGSATYTELMYAFAGILGNPTTTTPGGGVTARQHEWIIQASALQVPRTFTVEKGSSVRAHRAAHVFINELGLEFTRDEVTVDGAVVGRAIEDGVTMTPTPTDVALIPILGTQVSVYMDPTWAALGSTKLLDVTAANFSLGDRFQTFWPLDAAVTSFKDAYEVEPSSEVGLTMEANAAGMAILAQVRTGDTRYVRIEAVGSIIEATNAFRLTLDLPVKATDVPGFSDEDGIYGLGYTFGLFDDGANQAGRIRLINNIAAL